MQLINENLEYIRATATAKAVEIASYTGRWQETEDYKQEIILFFIVRSKHYDKRRGQFSTFVNMVMRSAQKDILRRMYRHKRQTINNAVELEKIENKIADSSRNETAEDLRDYIDNQLSGEDQEICRAAFIDGDNITTLAKRKARNRLEIAEKIRQAMRPFAESIGIHTSAGQMTDHQQSDATQTTPTTPEGQKVLPKPDFGGYHRGSSRNL